MVKVKKRNFSIRFKCPEEVEKTRGALSDLQGIEEKQVSSDKEVRDVMKTRVDANFCRKY